MTIILNDAGGHITVTVDGEDVGFINYAHSWHEDIGNIPNGYVYSAYFELKEPYRRMMLGTMAYEQFLDLMKRKGEKAVLGSPGSPAGARLMFNLGFEPWANEIIDMC
jgi:hypothetical protein